jgi:hypothetical protein
MALPRFVSSYLMFFSFGQGASFEWEDGRDSPSPTIHFSTIRNHAYEGRTWTACVDTLIMQMTSSSVFSVNGGLPPLLDLARGAADALAGHAFILDRQ